MAYLGGAWGRLPENAVAVFCNTGKEVEQTYQFVKDFEENTGCLVTWLEYDRDDTRKGGLKDPKVLHKVVGFETASRNGEPFEKMIRGKNYVPNVAHRICTAELKVDVCRRWVKRDLGVDSHRDIIGFRWDEPKRWNESIAKARGTSKYDAGVDLLDPNEPPDGEEPLGKPPCSGRIKDYPLVLAQVTKRMVEDFWKPVPWGLRMNSDYGNCDLCFLKGREKVVNIIREKPELADWWINAENIVKNRDIKKRDNKSKSMAFSERWSYENLKLIATTGLDLGDEPPDDSPHLPCFCFD
ncbi:MAG: hypothetical protein OXC91_07245 [Rhodobacteraceae bacterium]|nr:hypothetical protein [Paracoccaceae bacterium]